MCNCSNIKLFIKYLKGEVDNFSLSSSFFGFRTHNNQTFKTKDELVHYISEYEFLIESYKKEESHYNLYGYIDSTPVVIKIKVENGQIISIYFKKRDYSFVYQLYLSYDGEKYFGMQRQNELVSVQSVVEESLSKITMREETIKVASRTDRGVNAISNPVDFVCLEPIDNLKNKLNKILPKDIRVKRCILREETFSSRYDTVSKTYKYFISSSPKASKAMAYKIKNYKLLKANLESLIGKHDFLSFSKGEKEDSTRTIYSIKIKRFINKTVIYFKADGFLHNMIRFIVGEAINDDKNNMATLREKLEGLDKRLTPHIAPPEGLFLLRVRY